MRILGISGSLRQDSHNTRLLRAAASALPSAVELEIYDGLRGLPPYDADLDREPADPAVARLRQAITDADGILLLGKKPNRESVIEPTTPRGSAVPTAGAGRNRPRPEAGPLEPQPQG